MSNALISSILPLFHGPLVKIHVQPSNWEYRVSKNLLCTESPVFTAMLQGNFRESQEQTATLQEIDGVVYPEFRRTSPMDLPSYHPVR